jgi:hypothetical protein
MVLIFFYGFSILIFLNFKFKVIKLDLKLTQNKIEVIDYISQPKLILIFICQNNIVWKEIKEKNHYFN